MDTAARMGDIEQSGASSQPYLAKIIPGATSSDAKTVFGNVST